MKKKETLLKNTQELESVLTTTDRVFILFYASWCPHSLRFLPIFEHYAASTQQSCYRFIIDDFDDLCEQYAIEVYPTMIFFEKGKVSQRLDGTPGVGLNEQQLKDLLNSC